MKKNMNILIENIYLVYYLLCINIQYVFGDYIFLQYTYIN